MTNKYLSREEEIQCFDNYYKNNSLEELTPIFESNSWIMLKALKPYLHKIPNSIEVEDFIQEFKLHILQKIQNFDYKKYRFSTYFLSPKYVFNFYARIYRHLNSKNRTMVEYYFPMEEDTDIGDYEFDTKSVVLHQIYEKIFSCTDFTSQEKEVFYRNCVLGEIGHDISQELGKSQSYCNFVTRKIIDKLSRFCKDR